MLALKCMFPTCHYDVLYANTCPDEKNDKLKQLIRSKIEEYIGRAEALKTHIQQTEDKQAKNAIGANGMSNGGTGGKGTKCAAQLRFVVFKLLMFSEYKGKAMTMIQIRKPRSCEQVSQVLS